MYMQILGEENYYERFKLQLRNSDYTEGTTMALMKDWVYYNRKNKCGINEVEEYVENYLHHRVMWVDNFLYKKLTIPKCVS